ncbi:DUF2459 domain-containing protein [Aquimarina algicola]|uniref:DUF2459 domain-containing protein n=1 Tax=Aquimarina algicola TaxID=2589995 RepID=A0A504J2R8_9FLAO|nr:DUF2459 domain-containing protein [Aquimarina algicola]TPN84744.1 DUF2459 domain-containing protein [Aquimarina algicola]
MKYRNILKRIAKGIGIILLLPIVYIIIAMISMLITVNKTPQSDTDTQVVYLSTNGVHLSIIMPIKNITPALTKDLQFDNHDRYLSFGWGDADFYLNTPEWKDLTFRNAFSALFLKSKTLIQVKRYRQKRSKWIKIFVTPEELEALQLYITNTFAQNNNSTKIILPNSGYTVRDDFYHAKGSYTFYKTCNTWVNSAFKQSGLKACLWTPFDFGLLNKYE